MGAVGALLFACAGGQSDRTVDRAAAQDPFGNAPEAAGDGCTAGAMLTCFCQDGSARGSQTCLANGELSACSGCPSADQAGGAIDDGALCPMLSGQSGCEDQSFRSEELPASILFLVDRSGSMLCNPPEAGQSSAECEAMATTKNPAEPTKWDITVAALERVFEGLVGSGASAGLAFLSNDDVCGVNSRPTVAVRAVDGTHAASMASALSNTHPGGGTPIVGGAILAYAHLYEEAGQDGSGTCAQPPCGASGNRFVVLITDGADSCPGEPIAGACGGGSCTDFLLDQAVEEAMGVNIRTFVIGAPGSEPARGFLSELALSGGTARDPSGCTGDRHASTGDCHFDMTSSTDFAADLASALDAISGSAIGCEFPVPQPEGAAPTENVNVQYRPGGVGEPVCLPLDERPCEGGADGFQFGRNPDGSRDLSRVVLCGDACRRVQNDPAVQVDVVLGCQPIVLL